MFKYFHKGFQYLNFFGGTSQKKHPVKPEYVGYKHLVWAWSEMAERSGGRWQVKVAGLLLGLPGWSGPRPWLSPPLPDHPGLAHPV